MEVMGIENCGFAVAGCGFAKRGVNENYRANDTLMIPCPGLKMSGFCLVPGERFR